MTKRRSSGRPTINDVARHAGVSAISVSRALRTPLQVSEALRARIEAAIRALNYVPDPKARALASGHTNVIGVLIPSLGNFVFADVLRGVHDAVAGTDYQIQIGNTRYDQDEEDRLISLFIGQSPAALIVTGIDQSRAARRLLADCGLPVVQIMEIAPDPIDMMVGIAHDKAAEAIVGHLIDNGYERIGFLGGRMDPRVRRRLLGFRRALKTVGLYSARREITTKEVTTVRLGRILLRRLLAADPAADAVFCINDDLALGALFECQSQAIAVPERMGIVGFNDLELMAAAEPSRTSVRTNRYEMGRRAVELVLRRLGEGEPENKIVDLGFELVARDSTARRKLEEGRIAMV
jgi:LacI family gluconate utilization system Gnt-I transcriptional repressor